MSAAKWKTLPFETAVHSRGSGNSGLPTKQWLPAGQFPVIGQGAEDIEGWTDREDLLLTPTPAVVLYGGHTRRAKHVSQPFVPGPNVKILQPVPAVDSKFLYYFLTHLPVESKGYADHFPLVRKCDVPVPPLAEQQRIVGLLDEAFEGLATAKANAGKNLQNARALFESHLQSVFTQRGPGWVEKRLDALAEFSQGIQVGLSEQSNAPAKGLVRFIRIIDYTQGTDDIRYVPDPGRRYWADKSDIVMVRYGTPGLVGRGIEGVIANNLFKISILDGSLTNDFLAYFLGQQTVQNYLSSQGSSTMPALTFTQLGSVVVSFPHELKKQNEIVTKLDYLREETQRLARLYERKHAALEALKKSLLHQAFTGEL